MNILSIETSCDETAISLISINAQKTQIKVLGNELFSQAKLHEEFGGVYPNLARREHQRNLTPLLLKLLDQKPTGPIKKLNPKIKNILTREPELLRDFEDIITRLKKPKIDCIAVTKGPGLEPALWVGISFAQALGALWKTPVRGINHMEGHICAEMISEESKTKNNEYKIKKIALPALALLVSGGHTELVLIKKIGSYRIIGKTRDDAAGEAFDKVARILGLPYPGGPEISKLAKESRKLQEGSSMYKLPRPMIHTKDFDFSFSGLKTAVLYMAQKITNMESTIRRMIAREFEDAVVEVLIHKAKKAIETYKIKTLIVGGGVSANTYLKECLRQEIKADVAIHLPEKDLATDNAIMIGIVAGLKQKKLVTEKIKAEGNLEL